MRHDIREFFLTHCEFSTKIVSFFEQSVESHYYAEDSDKSNKEMEKTGLSSNWIFSGFKFKLILEKKEKLRTSMDHGFNELSLMFV
jgi:glycerol kinase